MVVQICQGKLLGVVKRRDRNRRDRLGVGKRYAPWLDPLFDRVPAVAGYGAHLQLGSRDEVHAQLVRRLAESDAMARLAIARWLIGVA